MGYRADVVLCVAVRTPADAEHLMAIYGPDTHDFCYVDPRRPLDWPADEDWRYHRGMTPAELEAAKQEVLTFVRIFAPEALEAT